MPTKSARSKSSPTWKRREGYALGLKTVNADMTAYGGFVWSRSGEVVAPDWKRQASCGNGLHFWLWGQGDASLKQGGDDAVWLVLEVEISKIVAISDGEKYKAPQCRGCRWGHA